MTTRPDPIPSGSAPGAPGIAPTWSSSDKDFVTTALGVSRLWATIGHGVLNEVYWPSTGEPRLRDLTFYLVHESGDERWVDLKRVRRYRLSRAGPTLPLVTIEHQGERDGVPYALELEFLPDTDRDALLIRYEITGPWHLVVVAAPHLDGEGADMSAVAEPDGMLWAIGGLTGVALALASREGFAHASVGFAGTSSDGWQDLDRHGRLVQAFASAEHGNVVLSGTTPSSRGVLALAISGSTAGARTLARSVMTEEVEAVRARLVAAWTAWGRALEGFDAGPLIESHPDLTSRIRDAALVSATVLKTHEDRDYPGALVASLSTPWGSSTNTLGGYHLVWPRDTVLTAFAFLALDMPDDARRILGHLIATQCADGHWSQNSYPSGEPFWTGVQLDEAAFPLVLAGKLREMDHDLPHGTAEMVRRATRFVVRTGPWTQQDRWEENPGINPFTLAVTIAGLVAAAPWLEGEERDEALDLADDWCSRIEEWCFVARSRWTEEIGVEGHYVRLNPDADWHGGDDLVMLGNRRGETIRAADLVAMEFSYLCRLGLRSANDPRVLDTLRVVDHVLGVETPSGTVYRRYNEDGYGEQADGAPYDGAGIGRLWPFLAGERGHLALDAGALADSHLRTMVECSSAGGLMPEQVWDAAPVPERGLEPGRPSGSAMPLLWTHAEFIKLLVARREGRPIERLDAVAERYARGRRPRASRWRDGAPLAALPETCDLVIEAAEPFSLHYGLDGWEAPGDREAESGPFGLWRIRFATSELLGHSQLVFTRRFGGRWEGRDHAVDLGGWRGVETARADTPPTSTLGAQR